MVEFIIKINNIVVGISTRYEKNYIRCIPYLTREPAEKTFEAAEEDLEYVRSKFMQLNEVKIEEIAVRDKLNTYLLEKNMATIHAAAVSVDGRAYLFTGPCGSGKTTHAVQWKKYFAERAEIINGDFPAITFEDGQVFASGTPWCGKEGFNVNKTVPVSGICFITKSDKNKIRKLESKQIIAKLFHQLLMPKSDHGLMQEYLNFANGLISTVPFYELECTISEDAVLTAYNFMNEEKEYDSR